jgi:hypothetical protein
MFEICIDSFHNPKAFGDDWQRNWDTDSACTGSIIRIASFV